MKLLSSLAFADALVTVPALTYAATQAVAPAKAKAVQTAAKPAATHATSGVVKSIDAGSLVITRGKKNATTDIRRSRCATQASASRRHTCPISSNGSIAPMTRGRRARKARA